MIKNHTVGRVSLNPINQFPTGCLSAQNQPLARQDLLWAFACQQRLQVGRGDFQAINRMMAKVFRQGDGVLHSFFGDDMQRGTGTEGREEYGMTQIGTEGRDERKVGCAWHLHSFNDCLNVVDELPMLNAHPFGLAC